ncbi:Tctex-1, partial [Tribonema minus]
QPAYRKRASVNQMREIIRAILEEQLSGQTYSGDVATAQTKKISDEIKDRLKTMSLDRYKYVVQVIIGEQRGEGVRMGCRCFWDADTDACASESFINDHIFCVATAYGIYHY